MRISALLAIALGMKHESLFGHIPDMPFYEDECGGIWYWLPEMVESPRRYLRVAARPTRGTDGPW